MMKIETNNTVTPILLSAALLLLAVSAAPSYAAEKTAQSYWAPEVVSLPHAATANIDLDRLVSRLKRTRAIGVLAKLDYHHRLNGLISDINIHHRDADPVRNPRLRLRFERIVNEVLNQLWKDDHRLYKDIANSRHALWYAVVEKGIND